MVEGLFNTLREYFFSIYIKSYSTKESIFNERKVSSRPYGNITSLRIFNPLREQNQPLGLRLYLSNASSFYYLNGHLVSFYYLNRLAWLKILNLILIFRLYFSTKFSIFVLS